MSRIIVYTGEGFTDRSIEFKSNVPNLADNGMNDSISSLKVIGAPWVAYYHVNYAGDHRVFEEGEYPTLVDRGQFSSLRMITEDLGNPEIQLWENVNYGGRSVILKHETDLHQVGFADTVSSHKVKSGVWVLYEHKSRGGRQLVSFPGQEVPKYGNMDFNDIVSHLRPLL